METEYEYDELIKTIVEKIINSLDENIYLPKSLHCLFSIDTHTLKEDLYNYIYSNSLR